MRGYRIAESGAVYPREVKKQVCAGTGWRRVVLYTRGKQKSKCARVQDGGEWCCIPAGSKKASVRGYRMAESGAVYLREAKKELRRFTQNRVCDKISW